MKGMLRLGYPALLVFILLISACATKIVDVDKSVTSLNLNEEQIEVVKPKMMAIKNMVDEYNEEKEQIEEELGDMAGSMPGGGMGGRPPGGMGGRPPDGMTEGGMGEFRERLEDFRKKREAYLSAINIHIDDIKAVLNEEQLAKFEKMKMPELEMPEMPGGPTRGMGGRPPGGMGGGGRGGGMF